MKNECSLKTYPNRNVHPMMIQKNKNVNLICAMEVYFLVLFVCFLLKKVPTFNHIWYSVYVDVHFLLAFRHNI